MDQIEEVRSKIDVAQFISEYVVLKKAGRNFKGLCPFHGEKTPSFMVSPERQIWKCFGCGKGGNVFNFVMEMERMEFGEALRFLAKRAGVTLSSYRPSETEKERELLYGINHVAAEFYHFLLMSHPIGKKALEYAIDRGLMPESLKTFMLGYAPPLWDGLQKFMIGKKGYRVDDLVKAGLVSKHGYNSTDFFRDRLIFPLRDHRGNYVGFAGRTIGPWDAKLGPKYINVPETPVYQKGSLLYGLETTKDAVKKENRAIIVEGELDTISSYQSGIKNAVAIKGSALTETQAKLLKRYCDDVSLALDMDVAGDMAARRGIEIADAIGLNIRVVQLPEGKDPDELARKDPEGLRESVKKAIPIYDFYIESAFKRHDASTPEGKRKIGNELLIIFSKIQDEILKSFYVRELAKRLSVSEEAVMSQMSKNQANQVSVKGKALIGETKVAKTRREVLEEHLLVLGFQCNDSESIIQALSTGLFQTPSYIKIAQILEGYLTEKNKIPVKSQEFSRELPAELVDIFNGFYLFDFGSRIDDQQWRQKEISKTLMELEKVVIQDKLKVIALEIAQRQKTDAGEDLEKLEKEFRTLSGRFTKLNEPENEPVV